MKSFVVSKRKVISIITMFLLLICMFSYYPYVFDRFISLPNRYIIYFGSILVLLILFIWNGKLKPLPRTFNYCFYIYIIFFLSYSLIHSDTVYFAWLVCAILSYVFLLISTNVSGLSIIVKFNNVIITIQVIMAFLAFFLILFGLLEPLFTFSNQDGREAYCFGLTCTNAVFGRLIRAAGFFDEPGTLAFWGVYALILNKLTSDNKKIEFLLIFGLFVTFSMAYIIQLCAYILLFYWKKPKIIISYCIIIFSAFLFIPSTENNDDFDLYNLTFKRFEINDSGSIETNRDELSARAKTFFVQKPLFGFGETTINEAYGLNNPYETLAKNGIIGTIILYLPLLLAVYIKRKDKKYILGICVLLIGYLQRPLQAHFIHIFNLYLLVLLSYVSGPNCAESDSHYSLL